MTSINSGTHRVEKTGSGLQILATLVTQAHQFFRRTIGGILDITPYNHLADRIGIDITFDDFIQKLPQDLTKADQKLILMNLIGKGYFSSSVLFVKKYNIQGVQIPYESFINGFLLGSVRLNGYTSKGEILAYLYLYKNPWEFYEKVLQLGYIELGYELKLQYRFLRKFSDKEMVFILDRYKIRGRLNPISFGYADEFVTIINSLALFPQKYIHLCEGQDSQPKNGPPKTGNGTYREEQLIPEKDISTASLSIQKRLNPILEIHFETRLSKFIEYLISKDLCLLSKKVVHSREDGDIELQRITTMVSTINISHSPICLAFIGSYGEKKVIMFLQKSDLYQITPHARDTYIYSSKHNFITDMRLRYSEFYKEGEDGPSLSILIFKMNGEKDSPQNRVAMNDQAYRIYG